MTSTSLPNLRIIQKRTNNFLSLAVQHGQNQRTVSMPVVLPQASQEETASYKAADHQIINRKAEFML